MEKLLIENGISICHPLPKNTITNERNKKYYENDLKLGYHPRGQCEDKGGCPVYQIWGDLDKPSNLIVPSVYFYPSAGGGTLTSNLNKILGTMGKGRVEITHNSPRERDSTHQTYMTTETIIGSCIESPFNLVLREDNELHEVLIYKTLEFLYEKNTNLDFKFRLGGKRTSGYGIAFVVRVNDKGNYLIKNRNCIGIEESESQSINEKFEKYIVDLTENFPIQGA